MIVIGAMAFLVAFAAYAILIAGLILASRWLATRHKACPDMPLCGYIRFALRSVIVTLVLAPVIFCVLYVPLVGVSSDGTRELGVIKPRLVNSMATAALISLVAGSVLAVIGTSIVAILSRKPAQG